MSKELHKLRGCKRWKEGSRAVEGVGVDAQSWHLPRWLGLVSSLAPTLSFGAGFAASAAAVVMAMEMAWIW